MATMQEIEKALVKADKAGDTDSARKLAAVLRRARLDIENQIPGEDVQETLLRPEADTSFVDDVVGAGEVAATMATGTALGIPAMMAATLKEIAAQIDSGKIGSQEATNLIQQAAQQAAQAVTYAPRTQAGREQIMAIGDVAEDLPASIPIIGPAGIVAANVKAAMPFAKAGTASASDAVVQAARDAGQKARLAIPITQSQSKPSPGTAASGGAAAVDMATIRRARAEELGFVDDAALTEGQATRQFEQQRFERETAKLQEEGAPIRDRFSAQHAQLINKLDEFARATGAEAPDLRAIGLAVSDALQSRAERDWARTGALYKEAKEAGELEAPAEVSSLIAHINDSMPEAEVANILKTARLKAIQLGAATEGPDGTLISTPITIDRAELLRRAIGDATNAEPTNIRQASIMKRLIDESTEGLGGEKYKKARASAAKYYSDYENIALIKHLIGTKRGTSDRAIALEDVLRRSVLDQSTSLDTVRQVRRLLQTEGEKGSQAWKELQGGTLNFIKDEATKGINKDSSGNPIVSPAQLDRVITKLDKSGKLDFIFGSQGAAQLRAINEVSKDALTAPPGTVNTSNTASVIAGMLDIAISGTSGIPAPIMTSFRLLTKKTKEAKTRDRVEKSLKAKKK